MTVEHVIDFGQYSGCTCPPMWLGVVPPHCPVHNPGAGRVWTTTVTSPCTCTLTPLYGRPAAACPLHNPAPPAPRVLTVWGQAVAVKGA